MSAKCNVEEKIVEYANRMVASGFEPLLDCTGSCTDERGKKTWRVHPAGTAGGDRYHRFAGPICHWNQCQV